MFERQALEAFLSGDGGQNSKFRVLRYELGGTVPVPALIFIYLRGVAGGDAPVSTLRFSFIRLIPTLGVYGTFLKSKLAGIAFDILSHFVSFFF